MHFVMRRVIKPIPLYAKKIHLHFPKNREWLGYDFEMGDWVAPHGKGKFSDVLFRCDTEKTGWAEGKGEVEMKFNNEEGIKIESESYLILGRVDK